MEEKQGYFRLGLFVLTSLAILFTVLFVLGGRSLFEPKLVIETYFDKSVAGLDVGAPVKFRGVPLGRVTEIVTSAALYERDVPVDKRKSYIVVRAEVAGTAEQVKQWQEELPDYVTRGMRAETQLGGITGQQYLALDFLDSKKFPTLEFGWKPNYLYVPSAPSLTGVIIDNLQQFVASLNEANIAALGKGLNKLVETLTLKLDRLAVADISDELVTVLKDADATIQHIDQVIAGAPVDQAVGNIASAAGRVDSLLADPGLEQIVDNVAVFTARLRALSASGKLDRIVKHLDEAIERADALLGDNQYDVRVIIQDLRATADNIRTLSEYLKRNPAGILMGGPPEKIQLPAKESR